MEELMDTSPSLPKPLESSHHFQETDPLALASPGQSFQNFPKFQVDKVESPGEMQFPAEEDDFQNIPKFQCANCSLLDTHKFTHLSYSTSPGQEHELNVSKITVLEAVSEIFNIKLEPLLVSCYEDLKLCSNCGLNLNVLYKSFKDFTQLSTVDSVITGLLKMDQSGSGGGNSVENETKKSLRKNPKQLVRFDNTDLTPVTKRGTGKGRQQRVKTAWGHSDQSSSPGTSTGTLNAPKEEVQSDYEEYDESYAEQDPNSSSLDIGVTSQGQFHCLNCGKVFPTKAGIILHMGFKHNITKDEAQEQLKDPSIAEKLNKFRKAERIEPKRKRKSLPKEDRIPLPCPHCPKSSWNQRDLNNHISSVHLKIKPFTCPLCEKAFSRKQQVEAHLKVHSGEKTSLCFLCGKSYSSAGALKGHLDRHFPKSAPPPNPVKFKCNLCNVQCTDMRRLNEHKLRHQDERNFQCDHCEKAFKTRRDLVKHRNYHKLKLEKPEQCPACEKRYSTKEILKFHLHSTHHYSLEDARSAAGIGLAAVVVYDEDRMETPSESFKVGMSSQRPQVQTFQSSHLGFGVGDNYNTSQDKLKY